MKSNLLPSRHKLLFMFTALLAAGAAVGFILSIMKVIP